MNFLLVISFLVIFSDAVKVETTKQSQPTTRQPTTRTLHQTKSKECKDSHFHCASTKRWCDRKDFLGKRQRRECPKTCGLCKKTTRPTPTIQSTHPKETTKLKPTTQQPQPKTSKQQQPKGSKQPQPTTSKHPTTKTSHQTKSKECKDSHFHCASTKRWCNRKDYLGKGQRRECPKTCGLCKKKTRPTPTTQSTHSRGSTLPPRITFPPHIGGCGKPDIQGVSRVIAGKTATPNSWSWQILMMFENRAMCGGTLIAPQWVVTAANCVYRREHTGAFSVRVGEHDREEYEGPEEDIRVVKVIRHEGYDPRHINNDIAMFKLERPVKFNKFVSPICLPKADVPVGSECYITGWGKTQHPGHMTRYLQQGLLPVVSNKQCYEKNHHRIPIPITDAMICGGSGGTERTSGCHGDNGGPFVCKVNGVWELHGSVSHGSAVCKSTETYTVFSRTFHFLDWIKKNMGTH